MISEGVFTGTHTGVLVIPQGEIQPTGKSVRLRYATVQKVESGKVASEHLYFDQAELMAQLGLLPGGPA